MDADDIADVVESFVDAVLDVPQNARHRVWRRLFIGLLGTAILAAVAFAVWQ